MTSLIEYLEAEEPEYIGLDIINRDLQYEKLKEFNITTAASHFADLQVPHVREGWRRYESLEGEDELNEHLFLDQLTAKELEVYYFLKNYHIQHYLGYSSLHLQHEDIYPKYLLEDVIDFTKYDFLLNKGNYDVYISNDFSDSEKTVYYHSFIVYNKSKNKYFRPVVDNAGKIFSKLKNETPHKKDMIFRYPDKYISYSSLLIIEGDVNKTLTIGVGKEILHYHINKIIADKKNKNIQYKKVHHFYVFEDASIINRGSYNIFSKDNSGYLRVPSRKIKKQVAIHRLVARAFCKNPNKDLYTVVNHKDGNKLNNHPSNLEWCTNEQNLKHAWETGLNPANPSPDKNYKIFDKN